jgi:adenine deaminase
MSYVIKNINIISMNNNEILYNHDIKISDDRIIAISKSINSDHTIDGTGKYLIPGLVDMHYHTDGNNENEMKLLIAHL